VTPKPPGRLIQAAHELNKRIQENPRKTLKITQGYYAEKVQAGHTEEADFALLMNSMMAARQESVSAVPPWFKAAGFVLGGFTLVFLMALVFASMWGHTVPRESRFLIHFVFSLASALCVAALGGEAAASGKIPFVGKHPLAFSATGGIAVLVIMLAALHWLYPVGP
jgi:hypothetical protein